MNLGSSLNGNLGKAPEQAAAVDMDKNRAKGPNDDLLVEPADLGKASKKPVLMTAIAFGIVAILVFNIVVKLMANDDAKEFVITVMHNGTAIELYGNPLKVNAYEDGEWIYEENRSLSENLAEIVEQMPVVEWNESFEMAVSDRTKLKWFNVYDENLACIRYFAGENDVSEFFADAEPGTYYVLAGARWEGRYVLKSFTNENITKEFCVAVVKE